jgi:putative carboxypeptidase yodJ
MHKGGKNIFTYLLAMVLSAWVTFTFLVISGTYETNYAYDRIQAQIAAQPTVSPVKTVTFAGTNNTQLKLKIPSQKLLKTSGIWAYVSKTQRISEDYQPKLANLAVEHGDWLEDKRASAEIQPELKDMFTAAKAAKNDLIVTSAYRSAADQKKLVAESKAKSGAAYTEKYVNQAGHSEHQLGLAVDLSSLDKDCKANFARCNLKKETATWLANNSYKYGFILRYPEGKEDLTGIEAESWHFRYVGKDMAKLVRDSGLTFDEIYKKISGNDKNYNQKSEKSKP